MCKMHWLSGVILFLATTLVFVNTECNICDTGTGLACSSSTSFKRCTDNQPTGEEIKCTAGYQCDYDGKCRTEAEIFEISCGECNKCDASKVFACITTTSFKLCLGTDQPQGIEGYCVDGTYCNAQDRNICGAGPPTCNLADDPTTTVAPTAPPVLPNPSAYCAYIATAGRYPVGVDEATTCRQYVRCIPKGTEWIGAIYQCPTNTYFSDTTSTCSATLPTRCNTNVARLQVASLRLL